MIILISIFVVLAIILLYNRGQLDLTVAVCFAALYIYTIFNTCYINSCRQNRREILNMADSANLCSMEASSQKATIAAKISGGKESSRKIIIITYNFEPNPRNRFENFIAKEAAARKEQVTTFLKPQSMADISKFDIFVNGYNFLFEQAPKFLGWTKTSGVTNDDGSIKRRPTLVNQYLAFRKLARGGLAIYPPEDMTLLMESKYYYKILPQELVLHYNFVCYDDKLSRKLPKYIAKFTTASIDRVVIKLGYSGSAYHVRICKVDELSALLATNGEFIRDARRQIGMKFPVIIQPFNEIVSNRFNEYRIIWINGKSTGYFAFGFIRDNGTKLMIPNRRIDLSTTLDRDIFATGLRGIQSIAAYLGYMPAILRTDVSWYADEKIEGGRHYYLNEIESIGAGNYFSQGIWNSDEPFPSSIDDLRASDLASKCVDSVDEQVYSAQAYLDIARGLYASLHNVNTKEQQIKFDAGNFVYLKTSAPSDNEVAAKGIYCALSTPTEKCAIMPHRRGAVMSHSQEGAVMPHRRGAVMPHQRGAVMPHQRGAVMPLKTAKLTLPSSSVVQIPQDLSSFIIKFPTKN